MSSEEDHGPAYRIHDLDDLCTTGEIAARCGVTPAAVSNWPARHADFPAPVIDKSAGKVKLYSWLAVREWLTEPRTYTVTLPARVGTRTLPARFARAEDTP